MQLKERLRTLMVGPEATAEEIRQAYLDLVRVWHPDRFPDPRLRQVAEEQLRRINEAYALLRNGVTPDAHAPGPSEAPPAQPAAPADQPQGPPHRPAARKRSFAYRFSVRPLAVKAAYGCGVAALCLAPLAAAAWWAQYWRAPLPGTDSLSARGILPNPQELMAEWTSDDAPSQAPVRVAPEQHSRPARREPAPAAASQAPLENGAELLAAGRARGEGEVHVVNQTEFEVMAGLIRGRELIREIYVAPRGAASITHIAVGVYRVRLEAGAGLDTRTLRFRSPAPPADPLGPFEFIEFTTASGTSGQYYEVIMRPNGAGPAPVAQVAPVAKAEGTR